MRAVHAGQYDKAGQPYHLHPEAVAAMCADEEAKVVALLHDVVEDTSATPDALAAAFSPEIAGHVCTLTHAKDEDYFAYIRRVKRDPVAAKVKAADLRHNLDLTRLPAVGLADVLRAGKYVEALKILLSDD
ncbi:MAG: bifunctional (p)ppGpp synthetase/guanosine-3',5'-bis(diphosphate) 3'-pyrophosphohydrolase [Clostridiales bacterium]|nr:bifunctional (p)ppGpp synthetase/guanosine-3',5'-bis(diphosphate) 3'-pyrophosphohydrolase [Clostridiales bacterium]